MEACGELTGGMAERPAIVTWTDAADIALGLMDGLQCERLAVTDPYGVIGICERNVLVAYQQRGARLGAISVADLMRRGRFWCRADDPPSRVLVIMERLKTDMLAVLDGRGRVLGTIHRNQLQAGEPGSH